MYIYRTGLVILFLASVFLSCHKGTSQIVKPVFKNLTYVSYRPVKTGNEVDLLIENYLQVDSTGMFHIINNSTDGERYDKIETDTSFRTPDSLIIELNKIFNGVHQLSFYGEASYTSNGDYSVAPLGFVSYETRKGLTDKIIVFHGASDQSFENTLNKFWRLPHARLRHPDKVYTNQALIEEIRDCQRKQHVYLR